MKLLLAIDDSKFAYLVLQQAIIRAQGQDSILKKAIGRKADYRWCYISWRLLLQRYVIRGSLRGSSLPQR
jgi:hypothetical protein